MNAKFLLKDHLFNTQKVGDLATFLTAVYPQFEANKFIKEVSKSLPKLELKQRIYWIRENLEKYLPNDFEVALEIIVKSLPKELDPNRSDNDFGDFIFAPLSDFVAKNGLQDKYLTPSFDALAEITKRFSCEDAIRFFINAYPQKTFVFMQKMATSKNYHQRRLACEGLRPKLPWSININFNYQKSIKILDQLYFDNTRFVVRSVANHLNDIAKIDADFVLQTLKKWQIEGKQKSKKEMDFLIRHALRTLIKQGNIEALTLLGYPSNIKIKIHNFNIKNRRIALGDYLRFSFIIKASKNQSLMIDYKIIYPSKTKRKSEKVFKIKQLFIKQNSSVLIQKKHLFKVMTSKKLHSGNYQILLQINGKIYAKDNFILTHKQPLL